MVRPGNKRLLKARMTNDGAGVNKSGIHFGIGKPIALQHVYNKKCTINCDETQGQNRIRSVINRDDKSRSIIKDFNLFKLKSQNIDSKQNNSRNELPSSTGEEPEITIPAVSIATDVETRTLTVQDIFYELDKAFDIDGETPGGESNINIEASDVNNKLDALKTKEGAKVSDAEFNVFNTLISQTVNKLKFFDLNGDTTEWTADSITSDAGVFLNAINNPKEMDFDETAPDAMQIVEADKFILVETETPGEFKVSKYSKVYENVKKELEAFKDEIISKKLTITIDNNNNKIEISMALNGNEYELKLKNNSLSNKIKLYHFSFKKNDKDQTWDKFTKNQNLSTSSLNNDSKDFSLTIFGGKELDAGQDILLGSIVKSDITTAKGFPFKIQDDSADILFNYSDDKGKTWKKGLVPDNTDMNSKPIQASITNYKEPSPQENKVIDGYIDKIMGRFYFGNFYNESDTNPVITMDDFNKAILYSQDDVLTLQNRLDQRHGNYLKYLLYKITKDKLVEQDTLDSERTTPKLKKDSITIIDDKLNIEFESTNVKKVYVFLTDNAVFESTSANEAGLSTLIKAVNDEKSPGANVLFKSEQQSAKTFKIPIHPNILNAETFSTTANSANSEGYSIKKSKNPDTIDGFYVGQSDEDKKSKSIELKLVIVAFGTSEAMMLIEKYKTPIPFENKEYTNGISDFNTNHDKVNKLKLTVAGDLTQQKITAFTVGLDKLKKVQTKLKELKHYNTGANPKNLDHSSKITTLDVELTRYNNLLMDWNKAVKLLSEMGLDINKTTDDNQKIINKLQNIARNIPAVWQQNLKKLGDLIKGWMDATDNVLLQKNKWSILVGALKKKEKDNATKARANLPAKYNTYFTTPLQTPPPPDSATVQNMHDYIISFSPASGAPTTETIINKVIEYNTEKTIHETIIGGGVFEPSTLDDKFRDHYYVAALNEIKTNYNGGYPSQAISLTDFTTDAEDADINAQRANFMTWLKQSKWVAEAYDNIFAKLVPHFDKRHIVVVDGIGEDFNTKHRPALSSYPTTINKILEDDFDPQPAKHSALIQLKTILKTQSFNLIASETAYSVAIDIHINNEQDRIVLDNAKKYLGGVAGIKHGNIGKVMQGSDVDTINNLIANAKFKNYPGIQAKKKETADQKTKYIELLTKLDSWYINGGNTFVKKGNEGAPDVQYTAFTFEKIHESTVPDLENTIEDVNAYNELLKTLNDDWNSTEAVLKGINLMYSNLSQTKTDTEALVYNDEDDELEKTTLDGLKTKLEIWKTIVDNFRTDANTAKQNKDKEALAVAQEKTGWTDHIRMPLDLSPDTNKNFIDNNIDDANDYTSLFQLSTSGRVMNTTSEVPKDTFTELKKVYGTDMPNPWKNESEGIVINDWCKFSLKQEEENVSLKNLIFSVDINPSSMQNPKIYGVDEMIITFKQSINALLTTADGIYSDFEKSSNTIIKLKDSATKQSNWIKNQSLFYGKKNIAKIKNGKGKEFLQAIQKIEVFCGGNVINTLRYKRLYTSTQRIGRISITTKTQEQKQERIRGGFELPEFLTRAAAVTEIIFDDITGDYDLNNGPNTLKDADTLYSASNIFNGITKQYWDDWIIDIDIKSTGKSDVEYLKKKNTSRVDKKTLYLIPQLDTTAAKILKTHSNTTKATVFPWKKNKDDSLFKMVHPLCKYGVKLEEWKKANFVSKAGVQAVMKTVKTFQDTLSRGVNIGIEEYTVDEKKMGRITIKQVDSKNPMKFFGAKLTLNKSIGAHDSAFIWKEATSKDEDIVIKDVNVDNTPGSEKTVIAFVKYTSPNGYDFDGILGEFEWTSGLEGLDFSNSNDENTITISNTTKSGTFKNLRPTAAVATTKQQESSRVDLVVVDSDKVAVILKGAQDIASFELNIYDNTENGTQLSESTITGDKTSDLEEIKRILDNNDLVHPEFIPSTSVLKENPDDISNESFRMLATCLSDESSFSKSIFCGILKVDTPNSEKTPDVDNVKIDFTII
uniref:Uncharacterized protein n=1 Tax=viral metagenome TaxID=1070528 RepID=A0A6C0C3F3_9ZZZZ